MNKYLRLQLLTSILFFLFVLQTLAQTSPAGLFLTWQNDPTSTMTIDWHTKAEDQAIDLLHFREKEQIPGHPLLPLLLTFLFQIVKYTV